MSFDLDSHNLSALLLLDDKARIPQSILKVLAERISRRNLVVTKIPDVGSVDWKKVDETAHAAFSRIVSAGAENPPDDELINKLIEGPMRNYAAQVILLSRNCTSPRMEHDQQAPELLYKTLVRGLRKTHLKDAAAILAMLMVEKSLTLTSSRASFEPDSTQFLLEVSEILYEADGEKDIWEALGLDEKAGVASSYRPYLAPLISTLVEQILQATQAVPQPNN